VQGCSPLTHPLTARKAHLPIKFHAENLHALPVARKSQSGKVLLCPQQEYPATSVANFRTAVLKIKRHTKPNNIFLTFGHLSTSIEKTFRHYILQEYSLLSSLSVCFISCEDKKGGRRND
jgi:hypothetical protein